MEPATCLFDIMDHSVSISDTGDSVGGGGNNNNNIPCNDDDDDSIASSSSTAALDSLDGKRKCSRPSSVLQHVLDMETILLDDASQLFHIALPCILMQVSQYWIFPVSSSMVGRKLGTYVRSLHLYITVEPVSLFVYMLSQRLFFHTVPYRSSTVV